ncbi:MAG TPA: PEP-CTERM system histidine kinase PrsK, partial [Novosphingobium sp.]|nr:PEP-CTERM system histidine kinase PrsK [Novosphingobium sp.]
MSAGISEASALGFWAFLAGGFACAVLAAWRYHKRGDRPEGEAELTALAATSLWCVLGAATGVDGVAASLGESLRNLAWLFFVYRAFAAHNEGAGGAVRAVFAALVFVELLHPALHMLAGSLPAAHAGQLVVFRLAVMFRIMFAVGALVLLHNLHVGAGSAARGRLRWTAAALAAMWIFDLNFYTVGYLGAEQPEGLGALRGGIAAVVAVLLAIGGLRGADQRLRPSRAVAFQSLSLMVIGAYLVVMVGASQSLAWVGGDVAPLAQIGFVFATTVLALVVLPSGRLRGWLKVTLAKHFFQHRYDYRAEWLRFTRTIGRGEEGAPLEERVIQAMGDITDSPSGLLLTPGEHGELSLAARWQWRTVEVPAEALAPAARHFFERDGFIVDLDRLR